MSTAVTKDKQDHAAFIVAEKKKAAEEKAAKEKAEAQRV